MRDRNLLPALAGIAVLAAALRFPTLDVQSFWFDEAVTATLLDQGLGGVLADVPDSESTPPLYYVLAWLWAQPFGTGEVGLRSLSALLGVATVPVAYAAGAELVSRRAGLVAAALVAVSPLLVWYSQEARSYALLVFLTALSLLFFARALPGLGRGATRGSLAAWAAVSALALATHYFAVFVVVPEAVWLLAAPATRRRAVAPVAAVGAVGAALLPLAIHQASNEGAAFIEDSSLAVRVAQLPKQYLVGFDAPLEGIATALAAALAIAGAAFLVRGGGRQRRGALVAGTVGGLAIAAPLALALAGIDFLLTRNLIAAAVPLAIVLGAGSAARGAGRAGPLAAAAYCALAAAIVVAVALEPRFQRDDWRGAAEALGPPRGDRAIAITPPEGALPLRYYLEGARPMPAEAPLRELAVLGLAQRGAGEEAEPPRNEVRFPPPMELLGRHEAPTFTLVRYRAAGPVPLTPGGVQATRLDQEQVGGVLFQPAGR